MNHQLKPTNQPTTVTINCIGNRSELLVPKGRSSQLRSRRSQVTRSSSEDMEFNKPACDDATRRSRGRAWVPLGAPGDSEASFAEENQLVIKVRAPSCYNLV